MKTKHCPRCDKNKSVNSFYKSNTISSGLTTYCKTCSDKKMAEHRKTESWRIYIRNYHRNYRQKKEWKDYIKKYMDKYLSDPDIYMYYRIYAMYYNEMKKQSKKEEVNG